MKNRWLAVVVVTLLVAQLVLVFVSWFLAATMTDGVRPLLSAEGLRWFLGHFSDMLASPLLVWLLLLALAWGSIDGCGLLHAKTDGRSRMALRLSLAVMVPYVLAIGLLCLSGGVLLSATGHLWPSPFSRALVPLSALGLMLFSAVYGVVSRTFPTIGAFVNALCSGVSSFAPLFVVYVLVIQFYESLRYVFF